MPDGRIEILIARDICTGALEGLTYPSGSMDKGFVKPTLVGLIRFFVSQVPLPENPGNIASTCQYLRKSYRAQSHPFTLQDRMGNSILHRVTARHQSRPSRGAGWADQKPFEAGTLAVQFIKVRGLYPWIAVLPNRAIALIVGDH